MHLEATREPIKYRLKTGEEVTLKSDKHLAGFFER